MSTPEVLGLFSTPNMAWSIIINLFSVVLTILTVASFIPQLRRICSLSSSADITIVQLLLILICATEHFTIFFLFLVNSGMPSNISHLPTTAGDWLNLTHVTVVWVMFFVLFCLTLHYKRRYKSCTTFLSVIFYIAFLLISVFPLFLDATTDAFQNPNQLGERILAVVMFMGAHCLYIHPLVSSLGFLSVLFQLWSVFRPSDRALSLRSLVVQSAVFALTGLSWIVRLNVLSKPPSAGEGEHNEDSGSENAVFIWYAALWWPVVDYLGFAAIQGILLAVALYRRRRARMAAGTGVGKDGEEGEEGEALLGEEIDLEDRERWRGVR
ncbi:uncharacterized protein BDV17DRAFT_291792 [Aspergillus undulatus]|uniref:uncharacterized protein n=1 Tax=Aspergillus undulatus TaxID=1810928 RepID=UPI003CCCF8AC